MSVSLYEIVHGKVYISLACGIRKWILCNNFYFKYKLNTFLIRIFESIYIVHFDYWLSNIKTYSTDLCINVYICTKKKTITVVHKKQPMLFRVSSLAFVSKICIAQLYRAISFFLMV